MPGNLRRVMQHIILEKYTVYFDWKTIRSGHIALQLPTAMDIVYPDLDTASPINMNMYNNFVTFSQNDVWHKHIVRTRGAGRHHLRSAADVDEVDANGNSFNVDERKDRIKRIQCIQPMVLDGVSAAHHGAHTRAGSQRHQTPVQPPRHRNRRGRPLRCGGRTLIFPSRRDWRWQLALCFERMMEMMMNVQILSDCPLSSPLF